MKTIFALILSLLATSAYAAPTCVPQAEMQEIARHFTQFSNLAEKDYCFDDSKESHLIAGIMFMRKTQFQQPMDTSKDELFSAKFAPNWYNYFIGRIDEFEIDNGCPKGVIAYVYAFGGKTMYVCSAALTNNFTALDRASVFMHEARHIDGFPHMTCSHGPRKGLQGACDNRISDTGSYAVTVETYSQLARYALDIHPALRAYARSSSVIYADEAFEKTVRIDRAQQFLVMANDKSFHALKADGSVLPLGTAPALGKIVMRSQHMILFPEDKTQNARFVYARNEGEPLQAAGDQAVEYNGMTPEKRATVVGVHIAAQWNAIVFHDKVKFACDPRSPSTADLKFEGERPVSLVYPNGYDRGAASTQIIMESGRVFDLGCPGKAPMLKPSSLSFDQKYKSIHKVGELVLGVTPDGFLRQITGNSSKPFPAGALDGKIYEIAPNQSIAFYNEN